MTLQNESDYHAYLNTALPSSTWTLTPLSGGMVNVTVRATLTSTSSQLVPSSLILKHAKPYVEAEGPSFPFSIMRQGAEATMLTLVHSSHGPFAAMTEAERSIHLPRLIYYGSSTEKGLHTFNSSLPESSILLISDLGPLVDCLEYFHQNSEVLDTTSVTAAGARVGQLLANLHNHKLQVVPESLQQDLTNELVYMAAIEPLQDHLAHLDNGKVLYQRVQEDFSYQDPANPRVLSHGDVHSGSVMIKAGIDEVVPVLIDMEFAKARGRGVNGDIAQFLAGIHCALLIADIEAQEAEARIIRCFLEGFTKAYRDSAGWMVRRRSDDQGPFLLRSAFILHGREIINYAHDTCNRPQYIGRLVDLGVWYLQRAADDTSAFLESENWELLSEEHNKLIQSLFKCDSSGG